MQAMNLLVIGASSLVPCAWATTHMEQYERTTSEHATGCAPPETRQACLGVPDPVTDGSTIPLGASDSTHLLQAALVCGAKY